MFRTTLAACLLLLIGAAPATRPSLPSAAGALARIRHAVGVAHLPEGIAIVEGDGQRDSPPTLYGLRNGALKQGAEWGYDGDLAWRFDERRGLAATLNRRQFEKQAWPLWVRSGWWLSPRSGFAVAVLPAESDGAILALRLTTRDAIVPATVYVDRATWLPRRLVVPYDRGPFTALYSDWRTAQGVKLPFAVEESYRGTSQRRIVSVRQLERGASFAPPAPANGHFDNSAPAAVALQPGTPLGPGATPHVYARPLVDGREIGPFLIDSGADGMMIDAQQAEALPVLGRTNSIGADGTPRPGTFRRGKSFRIGRLTIDDPLYLALDLSKNNAPTGERRAGVIGYDVLARAVIVFAGAGEGLAVCDPASFRLPAPGRWQKLGFIDATPAVRARYEGGREGLFQVDTGSAASVEFYPAAVERERLLRGRETKEESSHGAGGSYAVRTGRIAWFELGGRRFRDLPVSFRTGGLGRDGAAGVIGRDLLAGFTTIFDYPHRRIAFLPKDAWAEASRCR